MTEFENNLTSSAGRKTFYNFLSNNFDNADTILKKFDTLTRLYFEINSVVNISSLNKIDDIYIKHYLDSIHPYKMFSGNCGDVGCGGGFPTIPLAIVTALHFSGIESIGKKLALIKRVITETSTKNITPLYSRSEDLAKQHILFDTVCARAVSNADTTLSFCAPITKQYGKIILYKTSNDSPATIVTEKKYKIQLSDTIDYTLLDTNINRRIYIYTKL